MRSRIPVRLAPPAAAALALLAAVGCTVVDRPPTPAYVAAPSGYAAATPVYATSPAAAYGAADPYCREAQQEARAATREAQMAARDARVTSYAGAPDWIQSQDARRAASAAAEADRTRGFAARDCR